MCDEFPFFPILDEMVDYEMVDCEMVDEMVDDIKIYLLYHLINHLLLVYHVIWNLIKKEKERNYDLINHLTINHLMINHLISLTLNPIVS